MANDAYRTVLDCREAPKNQTGPGYSQQQQSFPGRGSIKSAAISILGLLSKEQNGRLYILDIEDPSFKLR